MTTELELQSTLETATDWGMRHVSHYRDTPRPRERLASSVGFINHWYDRLLGDATTTSCKNKSWGHEEILDHCLATYERTVKVDPDQGFTTMVFS